MNIKKEKALKLDWDTVAGVISDEIYKIIGKTVQCTVVIEEADFWAVNFYQYSMPLSELYMIFESVEASQSIRADSLPADIVETVSSIGMGLSQKLLQRHLQYEWQAELAAEDGLWLLGEKISDNPEPKLINICDLNVPVANLKSKQDLLDYLNENGATHTSLMDFCEDYRNQYHNELCWAYPISDGLHLGTYFVLVREGIICLPYDSADEEDYELFCPEEVKQLDVESLKNLICDWQSYSKELWRAMHSMLWFLKKQEAQKGNQNG